jgi:hypothetical protein
VIAYPDDDVEDRTGDILRSIAEIPKKLTASNSRVPTAADSFNLEDPKKELEGWVAKFQGYIRQWPIWHQLFGRSLTRKAGSLFSNSQVTLWAIECKRSLSESNLRHLESVLIRFC